MKITCDQAKHVSSDVAKSIQAWYDTAAQHYRNECYYRGLVQEIGLIFGDEAYISDDGSRQQDVLCAKVPELVRRLMQEQVHDQSA